MALYHRSLEKRRILQDFRRHEEEVVGSLCRLSNRPISPKTQMEQEKRIRREIANSNERRRMQSINAGFQSLRTLLPHHDGEKLSKAAILQQTAEYIYQMEQEKTRLLTQNCQLKRLLNQQSHDSDGGSSVDSPLPKRKKIDIVESADEGIGSMSPPGMSSEPNMEDLKREMIELRAQLDRERRLRMMLEDQTRSLELQLYPERIRDIAQQVYCDDPALEHPEQEILHQPQVSPQEHSPPPSPVSDPSKMEPAEVIIESRLPTIVEPSSGEMEQMRCSSSPQHSSRQYIMGSTSRQNLETIVEAIRHLEGDHLFRDDSSPSIMDTEEMGIDEPKDYSQRTALSPDAPSSFTCSPPYRQQVIHIPPVRPGVIVSMHS